MNLEEFRAAFPRMNTIETGGNCTALHLPLGGSRYLLITDMDATVPTDETSERKEVVLGVYDDEDEDGAIGGMASEMYFQGNFDEVAAEIRKVVPQVTITLGEEFRGAVVAARTPTNVAEYFQHVLGCEVSDKSLARLELDTECGRACRNAIDACKVMLNHVVDAVGATSTAHDSLIEICGEVCTVFWRG